MPIEPFTFSQLAGPLGGTLALTWATGAASGYYFAMKSLKERITFLEKQLKMADQVCEARIKNLDERYSSEIDTLKEILEANKYQLSALQKAIIEKQ